VLLQQINGLLFVMSNAVKAAAESAAGFENMKCMLQRCSMNCGPAACKGVPPAAAGSRPAPLLLMQESVRQTTRCQLPEDNLQYNPCHGASSAPQVIPALQDTTFPTI
jgi:hypothetical protein